MEQRFCIYCGGILPETGQCPCFSQYTGNIDRNATWVQGRRAAVAEASAHSAPEHIDDLEDFELPPNVVVRERFTEDPTELYPEEAEVLFWDPPATGSGKKEAPPRRRSSFLGVLMQLPKLVWQQCTDFLPNGRRLIDTGDLRYGLAFMLLSLLLTAGSTLLYGLVHLEDFLLRWYVTGFMIPIFAFGFSYFFLLLTVKKFGGHIDEKGLITTVGLSSVLPSVLQLLSLLFSTLDGSGRVFQFFALLILVTWLFSLLALSFAAHRVGINLWTILLSVAFAFLAIVALRAIWLWFLTGHFHFAFYLPSSLYPGELYEAFLS
jgi:hypothetical protein